jgi:hypothetical protein
MPGPITANPPSNLPKTVYVIPTFISGEDSLRIAYSIDLKRWTPLSDDPLFVPGGGNGVRDPQMWFRAGVYYVAFTAGNFGACSYWMIASSPDLITWSAFATVSMAAVTGANQVWMGPFFVDPATGLEYVFTAVSTDHTSGYLTSKIHSQTPVTPGNYATWSTPVEVTGTSFPARIIAERVVKIGSNYRFFIKDDVTGSPYIMTSTSLLSGYTLGSAVSWGTAYEGVGLASLGGSSWRAIIDKFGGNGMYYSDSTDNLATWSAPVIVLTNEVYNNADCMPTNNAKTILDALGGRTSTDPRFSNLFVGGTREANCASKIGGTYFIFDGTESPFYSWHFILRSNHNAKWDINGVENIDFFSYTLGAVPTRIDGTTGNLRQFRGDITIEQSGKGLRYISTTGPFDSAGSGTPEGSLAAPVGSTYRRSDGGTGTSFYVKQSGSGNTGWSSAAPVSLGTGWTANADAGDKTAVIGSTATLDGIATALNIVTAGAGTQLENIAQKVKAIEASLALLILPNA